MPLTKIQSLGITDGTIVNADINASAAIDGTKISGSFGKVLQVIQVTKLGTQTISGSNENSPETFTDITDLSVSITPSSASNKILILANVVGHGTNNSFLTAIRGSTNLAVPTSPSTRTPSFSGDFRTVGETSRTISMPIIFLDSPSTTSATTYKLGASIWGGNTLYINRSELDADAGYQTRAVSTLTVMEIAG
jgi:hypothetical protein